jgi:hypothetical protein
MEQLGYVTPTHKPVIIVVIQDQDVYIIQKVVMTYLIITAVMDVLNNLTLVVVAAIAQITEPVVRMDRHWLMVVLHCGHGHIMEDQHLDRVPAHTYIFMHIMMKIYLQYQVMRAVMG